MLERGKPQIATSEPESSDSFYRILEIRVAPAAEPVEPAESEAAAPAGPNDALPSPDRRAGGQNEPVNLARVAWLLTVIGCLVAVVILALDGYLGYAAVTLAVAVSAAINLT
jgi:hypothetical protein